MNFIEYSIISPLINKNNEYYENKISKLIIELETLLKKNNNLILGIYDLIDEPNRINNKIIIQKKRLDPIT